MYFSRVSIHPEFFKSAQSGKSPVQDSYRVHQRLWQLFTKEKKRTFIYREEIAREQVGTRAGVRGEPVYYLVSNAKPVTDNSIFKVENREYTPKLEVGDKLQFDLRANPVITRNGCKHDVVMDAQRSLLLSLCRKFNLQQYLPPVPQKGDFKSVLITHGGRKLDNELTDILQNDLHYAERLQSSLDLRDKLNWSLRAVIDKALAEWLVKKANNHGFRLCRDNDKQYKLQNSGYCWHSLAKKTGKRGKTGFSSVDFTGEIEVIDVDIFLAALFTGIGRSKAFGCGLLLVKRS
jgi:CRISPR system Cascade subunit CasE